MSSGRQSNLTRENSLISEDSSRSSNDKFSLRNKDTGETFDLKDLAAVQPIDGTSIFPSEFNSAHCQKKKEKVDVSVHFLSHKLKIVSIKVSSNEKKKGK